jgi:hypothetical protein
VDRTKLTPLVGQPHPIHQDGGIHFKSSIAKMRVAAVTVLAATLPAAAGFLSAAPLVRWLCIIWLAAVAFVLHFLARRALVDSVILSIDERGIRDHRLMPTHIEWQEIEAICPVDAIRGRVVDIMLRNPKFTLANTRWSVRVGAYCQIGYGVPAITISLLLLDGTVSDVLHAVAHYRPNLLHYTNR